MEMDVFVKGRQTYPTQKYSYNFTNIFFVFVSNSCRCIQSNRLQRDFLWKGLGKESKFHLVNWDKIHTQYQIGELAVQNLYLFNKGLLGKRLWQYSEERGHCGGGQQIKSTNLLGVVGVRKMTEGRMGLVCGSIFKRGGLNFLNSLSLRQVMVQEQSYSLIPSVVVNPLGSHSMSYLELLG